MRRPNDVQMKTCSFQPQKHADSSDITWGNFSHFTHLPLEPQKKLFTPGLPKTCKLQIFFTSAMRGATRICCVAYIVSSESVCKRTSTYLEFIETPLALQGNQLPICWKTKMATKFEQALQRHLYSVTDKAAPFLLPGKLPTFNLIWFDLIWSVWSDLILQCPPVDTDTLCMCGTCPLKQTRQSAVIHVCLAA